MIEQNPPNHSPDEGAPRLLLQRDFEFGGHSLVEALEASGYEAQLLAEDSSLEKTLAELRQPPDLLIVHLLHGEDEPVASLAELRRGKRIAGMSILGVARFDQIQLDIPELRSLGVVGVVDERADCATALRRIHQTFGGSRPGRRAERVRCFLPVRVQRDAVESDEFGLDLSRTGMRLTITEPLEANTDISLAFKLPSLSDDEIQLRARIIHRTHSPNSAGRWEMGVFFYPMSDEALSLIEAEITRLLQG